MILVALVAISMPFWIADMLREAREARWRREARFCFTPEHEEDEKIWSDRGLTPDEIADHRYEWRSVMTSLGRKGGHRVGSLTLAEQQEMTDTERPDRLAHWRALTNTDKAWALFGLACCAFAIFALAKGFIELI